nr:SDR family oxidoreductase [Paracoccus sp. S-4012]
MVTGGSRGIGRAVALGAAARGWDVALSYVSDAAAAGAVADQARAAGVRAQAIRADATEEADTLALFDAAEAGFGGIDVVVVNAGIIATAMPLAEMDLARIERMIRINLTGALLTAREAARRLPEGGAIVFLSSAAARNGSPGEFVDYAASKGGVDSLTIGLGKELAPRGIRVAGVRPGLIETDIHASSGDPARVANRMGGVPMGRAGTAEEVAEAVLWLASAQASYVTGAILDVAGGR